MLNNEYSNILAESLSNITQILESPGYAVSFYHVSEEFGTSSHRGVVKDVHISSTGRVTYDILSYTYGVVFKEVVSRDVCGLPFEWLGPLHKPTDPLFGLSYKPSFLG